MRAPQRTLNIERGWMSSYVRSLQKSHNTILIIVSWASNEKIWQCVFRIDKIVSFDKESFDEMMRITTNGKSGIHCSLLNSYSVTSIWNLIDQEHTIRFFISPSTRASATSTRSCRQHITRLHYNVQIISHFLSKKNLNTEGHRCECEGKWKSRPNSWPIVAFDSNERRAHMCW